MTVVSFFNHKGGVGKTTLMFNIGVALSTLGYRVCFVDGDAQANLTGLALTETQYDQAIDENRTIWSSLAPLVTGAGDINSISPISIRPEVWILPGDLRLSNFEAILPVGWTEALAGTVRGFRATSALHRVFEQLRAETNAAYVFVDLGPNVGALNRSALMASDGVVIPLAPDRFSLMALPSVGTSVATWSREWAIARENEPDAIDFSLPVGKPKPLGYVSQQFSVYGNRPVAAFRTWLDEIADAYADGVLEPLGLSTDGDHELGSLKNFSAIVPLAQRANKALFELSGNEARGAQNTRARATKALFSGIAEKIVTLSS